MSAKTMISLKMDKDLKRAAEDTAAEFGLPLGTMINVLVRQVTRSKELRLSAALTPTPYLRKIIEESEKALASGKLKKYGSVEELAKALRS